VIGSLAGLTIVTQDLDISVAAYQKWLGYRSGPILEVGLEKATLWGAPQAAGARMVEMRPESGEARFIRFVEGVPDPGYQPLKHYGWAAAEIIVQDVEKLAQRLDNEACPFTIIGAPAVLDFDFTDKIKAMQVVGPSGEVLYLTEVGAEIPGFDLPQAQSFVGQLFIMVLGAPDMARGADSYATLDCPIGPAIAARIDVLSHVHNLPLTHRHQLTTVALEDKSFLEIDAYPDSATARPLSSIGLPSGIAMVSFHARQPGSAPTLRIANAGEWLEIL